MKKTLLTIWVFVLTILTVSAQYSENIRSGRPGKAVGPFSTGTNVLQIQTGLVYEDFVNHDNDQKGNSLEYTTSLRYGIIQRLEIRSAFKVRHDKTNMGERDSRKFGGLSFWNLGIRYNLVTGTENKPSFGIQSDIKLTTIDPEYQTSYISPRLMFIHGQKLTEVFFITSNLSASLDGNNQQAVLGYIVNISFLFSKSWKGFIEKYGEAYSTSFQSRLNTGLAYLVNKDFQLDFSGGFGTNDTINDWFIDGGVSWRVKL
jgi:hypothetical protein